MKPEDRDRARELVTRAVLWELLAAEEEKVDFVTWRRKGGPEAVIFLQALESGGQHPALLKWENLKATAVGNRPAPDPLDLSARRIVVSLTEALHRAGLTKHDARKQAAKALKRVFPATYDQIRYWQDSYPISAKHEKLIASAITRHGDDHRHIVGWFVGLIRLVVDPEAIRGVQLMARSS